MRNSYITIFLILGIFLLPLGAKAQYTYKLTHSSGVYEPVTQGLIISAPDENESHWDENGFVFQFDEPFKFPDIDEPYTVGIVSTNGEIVLIGDGDQPTRFLGPLSVDLVDKRIFGGGGNSEIVLSYESGITKIEWVDASTFCAVLGLQEDEGVSVAAWFYHDTGIFEYHYGPNTLSASTENCMYGPLENKPLIGFFDVDQTFEFISGYFVTEDPFNPEFVFTEDPFFEENITSLPREGLIYRFTWEQSSSTRSFTNDFEAVVAPNPFSSELQISSEALKGGEQVRITDLQGKPVYAGVWNAGESIRLTHLMPGIYFLEISASQGVFRSKILKH